MNWSKGYSATYYAKRVDPDTWRDLETIELTGGSIKREPSGLRESADVDCVNYNTGIEQWVRVYLDTRQDDGSASHTALFTGLATSPEAEISGIVRNNQLSCYSVLKPADDIYLLRGWFAPAGSRGGDIIKQLLEVTPAPVEIAEGSPRLSASIVAEDNETRMTMVDKVLDAIDWRIKISGSGRIRIEPKPIEAAASFDPIENDVIETQVKISADWYSCPNVYMAINEDMTGIARDDSILSPLSVVNRGREVWLVDDNVELSENESISRYAQRKLLEAQKVQKTAEYDRRYFPDISPGDLVQMHYPTQGLEGLYTIDSQSIDLGYGARTSEKISTYITADSLKDRSRDVLFVYIVDDLDYRIVTDQGNPIVGLTEV